MKHKKAKHKLNRRAKTIEEFEQVFWGDAEVGSSHLVETCHRLRRKPLDTFSIEDYRILIGQNMALDLLMPSALKILETNIAAEGDLYEGDLLSSVLRSEESFWKNNLEMKRDVIRMVTENMQELLDREIMGRQMKGRLMRLRTSNQSPFLRSIFSITRICYFFTFSLVAKSISFVVGVPAAPHCA